MAPRAYWKGYLKLSLVSCPIALYPATSSSERVSFNRINKKTGNRLKQQQVDADELKLLAQVLNTIHNLAHQAKFAASDLPASISIP